MRALKGAGVMLAMLAVAIVFQPRHIVWSQPVNPPPAILKGTAPGGIGSACNASPLIGYLDSSGRVVTCVSSLWTVVGASTGAVWGTITGTLSNQTDLQTALNALAPLASPTFTGTVTLPNSTVTNAMLAGSIANNKLTNSSTTVAGASCTLGSSCSPASTGLSDSASLVRTSDTATVTNTMLAGSIANAKLTNAATTVNGQTCTLGSTCNVNGPLLVGSASNTNGSASNSITVSYAPTTGNTVIVVACFMAFTSAVPSSATLSDGGNNTYTQDDTYSASANLGSTRYPGYYVFRKSNVTGGSFTYTFTDTPPSGETYTHSIFVLEYSGLTNSSPLDGTPVHVTDSTGSAGADSGALTTTNAADLLVGIYVLPASGSNGMCVPTNLSALVGTRSDVTIVPSGVFTRYVTTTGSKHATCGYPAASTNKSIIGQMAYKGA